MHGLALRRAEAVDHGIRRELDTDGIHHERVTVVMGDGMTHGRWHHFLRVGFVHAHVADMIVALIDEENATLKRFFRSADGIRLEPSNDAYLPIYVSEPERLRIQGLLRGVLRKYPRQNVVDGD